MQNGLFFGVVVKNGKIVYNIEHLGKEDIDMELEKAVEILKKYVKQENLQKHCFAVAATMKHFAKLNQEDEKYWQIVGMLHDIDYELYPEEHCVKCKEILEKEGFDENFIHSVQSHGYGIVQNEIKPELKMEKILFTIDELTGLITATALMQPNKTLEEVKVKSVKKKWKDKKFAAKVNRELIAKRSRRNRIRIRRCYMSKHLRDYKQNTKS